MGNKKIIKTVLAATMLTSTMMSASPVVATDGLLNNTTKLPTLVPSPKEVTYLDGTVSIDKSVNLKGKDVADKDAIKELVDYLQENEITINETEQAGAATIILGEEDDDVAGLVEARDKLGLQDAANLKSEGYVLGSDSATNTIVIEGKDGDGTFYGVKTLLQLATKENGTVKAREVKIEDEPTMTTRGSIEGFYGTPWTHQDRLDQIKFYGDHKLNTYIYAPKDDRYHREQWREPYPDSEIARMNELIETSKQNKVDFVFSLSPGNDIRFTGTQGEADFNALVNKCQIMYDMGVRSFAIFFDDIKNKQGTEQAEFLNRFNKQFIEAKGDITPLITVPTEYDTNAMSNGTTLNAYTKGFSETLDPNIKVLWTGTAVVPEGIDVDNAKYVKSIYGNRIGIWWNYPVTDYIKDKLALGPIYGLDKGLQNELDFLVINPMEHADLSKISIATGADYAWNTDAYDYNKSFVNSIDNLYGDLAPYMYTFANHSSRLVAGWASTGRDDAPEIRALMDEFIKNIAKGIDATEQIAALTQEFDNMILAADTLKARLTPEQLSHCSANLDKLKALGQADKIALDLFVAIGADNHEEVDRLKATLRNKLPSLSQGKLVSEKTALQFVKDALEYNPEAKAGFELSSTFVKPGQEIQLKSTSSISATELEWTFEGANIETSNVENPVISYAHEGVYTVSLKAKNKLGEDVLVKEGAITVSNEAGGETINLALGKTATASGYTAASEAPVKAIDGIKSTKWCAVGNRAHTLTIDLGKEVTVENVKISHAEIGGEGSALNTKDYRLLVSTDGNDFKEVANVTNNTAGETIDNIPVSIARYVKLVIDKPTQGGDSAARIYEVEVNGLDKAIDLPGIFVPSNKAILIEKLAVANEELAKNDVYTAQSLAKLQAAVDQATVILQDNGINQEAVDQAVTVLQTAIDELEKIAVETVNKTFLEIAVSMAEAVSQDKLNQVIPVVKKEFDTALDAAKETLENQHATQTQVNDAFARLSKAMQLLEFVKADKTALQTLIDEVEALKQEDYTEASWKVLTEKLNGAKDVINDENALQYEADAAKDALKAAKDALVEIEKPVEVDKSKLQAFYNQVVKTEEAKYLPDTWTGFKAALDAAKGVLDNTNASQDEVNSAYNALVKAYLDLRLVPNKDALKDLITKAESLNNPKLAKAIAEAKAVVADENATEAQVKGAYATLEAAIKGLDTGDKAVATGDNLSPLPFLGLAGLGLAGLWLSRKKED